MNSKTKVNNNKKPNENQKNNKVINKNNKNEDNDSNNLNIIEYNNNSELKTKKKEFINKVDPHNLKRLIQKEKCIWFGVHNELL